MVIRKRILIAVVVLLAIPVLFALFTIADQFRKSLAAKEKIVVARQAAEQATDAKMNEVVDSLRRSKTVDAELAVSKVDVCYMDHTDRGWIIESWYQDCYLRYVGGFTTSLSKEEVREWVKHYPGLLAYFGDETVPMNPQHCSLFEKNYQPTLLYRPANVPADEYSCEVPHPVYEGLDARGPLLIGDRFSVKTYRTFDPAVINNMQNQIWITFDEQYYHEALGCGVGIILCSQPQGRPVHP